MRSMQALQAEAEGEAMKPVPAVCPHCNREVAGLVGTIAKDGRGVVHVIETKKHLLPVLTHCPGSNQPVPQPKPDTTTEPACS